MEEEQKAACGSVEIQLYKQTRRTLSTGVRIVSVELHIAKPQRVFLETEVGEREKEDRALHPETQGHPMFSCEIPKGKWDGG